MNIVIVIDSVVNRTNGSVMTALRFTDGLRKRGHTVRLVAVGAAGEDDCRLDELYVPLLSEVSAKHQVAFGKFDREKVGRAFEGADIVHFIFPFGLEKRCKRLADEMGIPSTAAFHVQPENITYNIGLGRLPFVNSLIYGIFRRYYDRFERIHCPSPFIAEQLTSRGYKGEPYVISNGYDPDFTPPEHRERGDKFEIVMTGRLSPEKNQQILIKAIALSAHRKNIRLTLLGNGPKRKYLERLATDFGVDVTFEFLPKERLIERLRASHLYVHSATVEIEAIAAIEAIACGLVPIIADSPLSATPQFALDERSLFACNDARELARRIDYWYEHDEEREISGKIYAEFAKRFSLERSLEKAERMFADQIKFYKASVKQTDATATERKRCKRQFFRA